MTVEAGKRFKFRLGFETEREGGIFSAGGGKAWREAMLSGNSQPGGCRGRRPGTPSGGIQGFPVCE